MPGMPGTPGMAAPAPVAAPVEAKGKNFVDLRQFIPSSLHQAAGIHLGRVKAGGSELAEQLRTIMMPVVDVGVRSGIKAEEIELVLAGTDKQRSSVLVCLKTKSRLAEAAIVKALGADEQGEKIGKSTVRKLPAVPGHENAMAVIDGDTLIVGRKSLVEEALRNPKEGPVRNGLDTIDLGNTVFFVAGETLGEQAMSKNGMRLLATVAESKGTPSSGMAFGIVASGQSSSATGQANPASVGSPDPAMMVAMPAGGPGSPAGPATAMHGSSPAMPTGTPGMHGAPAATPGATPAAPAAPIPASTATATLTGNVEVVVGMNFPTEVAAREVERRIIGSRKNLDDLQKAILEALHRGRQGQGANPAGGAAVPAGAPGSPAGPAVPAGPAGMGQGASNLSVSPRGAGRPSPHPADFAPIEPGVWKRFDPFARGLLESYAQQPAGSPAGPAGMGAHGAGAPNPADPAMGIAPPNAVSPGTNAGDPRLNFELAFTPLREGTFVRLSARIESLTLRNQLGRLGDALGAAGVTAIDDGIYAGTLSRLHQPFTTWLTDSSKADVHKGLRRLANMPVRAGYSWMTEMLPYVGREDTYLKFNFDKSWSDPENFEFTRQVVPQFLNPGDSRQQLRGGPFDGQGATHFVGVSGVEDNRNDVAASWPRTDPRAGVFGYDGIAKPEQITDGQSNTIMLIGAGQVIGGWVHGGGATVRGARAPYFDSTTGFGSRGIEGGGAYVLMSDGSTRVISSSIDPKLFRALCTTHGAEQVDATAIPVPTAGGTTPAPTGKDGPAAAAWEKPADDKPNGKPAESPPADDKAASGANKDKPADDNPFKKK
jgi:hypothetical protein